MSNTLTVRYTDSKGVRRSFTRSSYCREIMTGSVFYNFPQAVDDTHGYTLSFVYKGHVTTANKPVSLVEVTDIITPEEFSVLGVSMDQVSTAASIESRQSSWNTHFYTNHVRIRLSVRNLDPRFFNAFLVHTLSGVAKRRAVVRFPEEYYRAPRENVHITRFVDEVREYVKLRTPRNRIQVFDFPRRRWANL